jgi:hypothetical protein
MNTQATMVVAAAATAAGQYPEDAIGRRVWQARVRSLADFLWAEADALTARTALVAKEITLTGRLISAEAHSMGRGKVVVSSEQGRHPDVMWTGFLTDPEAATLLDQAKALVGTQVVVRKRIERESPNSTVTHPRLLMIRGAETGPAEGVPSTADELINAAGTTLGLDAAYVVARAQEILGPRRAGQPRTPSEVAKVWDELRRSRPVSA